MTSNQFDSDAERLRILRINHPTAHASPSCATCFLLRQIDIRDVDLRGKEAEIEKLRGFLNQTAQERDKWFGLTRDEQVSSKGREKQITETREEITSLRSAAREALRCTMEMAKVVGISTDALNSLANLQRVLVEYDAERAKIIIELRQKATSLYSTLHNNEAKHYEVVAAFLEAR